MLKKSLFVLFAVFLFCASGASAQDQLACQDLDLFGYRIGMSYEDAVNVRTFRAVSHSEQEAVGVVDGLRIDETAFAVKVHFKNDRVFKIVSRFNPEKLEQVASNIKSALGKNGDQSKTLTVSGTNVNILTHFHWAYPKTRIDLVSLSKNPQFATLSMLPNRHNQANKKNL